MKYKVIKQDILRILGNQFLHGAVSVLCKTVKLNIKNAEKTDTLIKDGQNIVFAFWHGTMLIPWFLQRDKNFSSLVSQSKDGDLLANVLTKWNYHIERGSSHKGGKEALEMLVEKANNKYSISITPDGPTGPARILKAGAVIIAQRSAIPLVLCGVAYKKKYVFEKSWDKFEIPKLFSKINVVYSDPIYIGNELDREEVSKIIDGCSSMLNKLQKEAENFD